MSVKTEELVRNLTESIANVGKDKTVPYDTSATIERVDGDTAWVNIPGGNFSTPVKLTINAKAGDQVQVRVSGGTAFIIGNITSPPTDDEKAKQAAIIAEDARLYMKTHLKLADEGLYVMTDEGKWQVLVANDGVYILNPEKKAVAKYKDSATIGLDDGTQSYTYQDYRSFRMLDREGNEYLYISDLRDERGFASLSESFVYDNDEIKNPISVELPVYPEDSPTDISSCSVTVDGIEVAFSRNEKQFTLTNTPEIGSEIIISYMTTSSAAKAFTLGSRLANAHIGARSVVEGFNVTASGSFSHGEGVSTIASGNTSHAEGNSTTASGHHSHSEGHSTTASGNPSHAEGYLTTASGVSSHAEGYSTTASGSVSHAEGSRTTASRDGSHAEGYSTTASGNYSHAEGSATTASGDCSHAGGNGTIAAKPGQTAIGNYNKKDTTSGNYNGQAFIIGKGGSDSTRSNLFTVNWAGIVDLLHTSACTYRITDEQLDLKAANNNLPANRWAGLAIRDKNEYVASGFYSAPRTNGQTGTGMWVYNRNSAGTQVTSGSIIIYADKAGNITYSLTNPAAFRNALGASSGVWPADMIPGLNTSKLTAGTLPVGRGGTGKTYGYTWQSIATTTGTTAKTFNLTNYSEIMVVCKAPANGSTYCGSVVIPKAALTTTEQEWYLGGGRSGASTTSMAGRRACCKLTTTSITPLTLNVDGATQNGNWTVYAR